MPTYRTATQWGVYTVEVVNGRIRNVASIAEDPAPSALGEALRDGVQHDTRIRRPAIRKRWLESSFNYRDTAHRGCDEFVDVPWDEALEIASAELSHVIEQHGNTSIFGGSYGWASAGRFNHAQSQLHRFINLVGGCTRAMNSYSTAAAQVILPHVVAPWHEVELQQPNWRDIARECQLFVAFGGLPLRNTQVAYGGITEHQSQGGIRSAIEAGVEFVNVSPLASDGDDAPPVEWLAPRPGTDVALMLGLAYWLETHDAVDRHFLSTHCTGYEPFRTYLLGEADGQPKSPQWAAAICDVPVAQITTLAQKMSTKRTFLTAAWSLQRAQHGEQPYWMLVTLACMLGQVGLPGGGFGFGYGAEGFVGSPWRRFHWANHSKGMNPTRFAIPVARIADMLLNPGATIDYNGQKITYPDTQLIYWAGGNPFHHHQDLNRLCAAWRKPRTVIVNEPWWTPVAQWADIVFPATTQLERIDICASSHDPYAHFMEQVIPPQYDARSDHHIFQGLARHMGVEEAFTEGKSEYEWLQDMWERSNERARKEGFELPTFAEFVDQKVFKIPDAQDSPVWLADFRLQPQAKPLATPSGKLEIYSETIAGFDDDSLMGHAAWYEPSEWLGGQVDGYPLHLLSPQPAKRLHSQFDHADHSQSGKVAGCEPITLHPDTAAQRGIEDGDRVRVFNQRGACLAGAVLDERMRRDVVALPTGAWFKPEDPSLSESLELNGNPNVLTPDLGTSSLAQGPSANTCLVQVERYSG